MEQASNAKNYSLGYLNEDEQKSLELTILMMKQQKSFYFNIKINLSLLSRPKTQTLGSASAYSKGTSECVYVCMCVNTCVCAFFHFFNNGNCLSKDDCCLHSLGQLMKR